MAGHQPLDVPRMVPKAGRPPPRPQAQPPDGRRGPKARDAKLQVSGHFSGPGALCTLLEVLGGGGPHGEGSQGQSEGRGLCGDSAGPGPPCSACPSASGAHASCCTRLRRHPSRRVSGRMDYRTKVEAALTGTRSLERSRTSARACMRTKPGQTRRPAGPELTTGWVTTWHAVARKTRARADPRQEGRPG